MSSLLPTPEPTDPVEGQPGHFEHSNWLKASVKALDAGVVHKAGDTMTGELAFVIPGASSTLTPGNLSLRKDGDYGSRLYLSDMSENASVLTRAGGVVGLYESTAANGLTGNLARLQVGSPSADNDAVTKRYLNDVLPPAPGWWADWTPLFGGNPFSQGNGSIIGRYCRIGNTVHYEVKVSLGSSSILDNPTLLLPVIKRPGLMGHHVAHLGDENAFFQLYTYEMAGGVHLRPVAEGGRAGAFPQNNPCPIPGNGNVTISIAGTYECVE